MRKREKKKTKKEKQHFRIVRTNHRWRAHDRVRRVVHGALVNCVFVASLVVDVGTAAIGAVDGDEFVAPMTPAPYDQADRNARHQAFVNMNKEEEKTCRVNK